MVKILIVLMGEFKTDGITNNTMNYYLNYNKNKIHIDFLCKGIDSPKQEWLDMLKNNGSKVYAIPYRNQRTFKYIKEMRKIIREGQYDIVHAMGSSSLLVVEMYAAYKENIKIRISHSRNSTCKHRILNKILKPYFFKYTNVRFACGEVAGKWLYGDKQFTIIRNGNDTNKFEYRNGQDKILKIDSSKLNIVSVGSINKQKNYEYFMKVISELSKRKINFKYYILGRNPQGLQEQLINYLKNNDILDKVEFIGSVDNPQDYLSASDIFVLPSLYEGFPNVLIEAQMNGISCIVSNTITDQACICDNVYRLGITDNDILKWVDTILCIDKNVDRGFQSKKNIKVLREKGYDIVENAKWLENKYIELVNSMDKL